MNKSTLTLLLLLIFSCMLSAQSDSLTTAYQAATYESSSGLKLPYRILWPEAYHQQEMQAYPLVIFLHGAGERGNDNLRQLVHGSDLFVAKQKDFPAIVVFPQCGEEDYWAQMVKTDTSREFNFNEAPNPGLGAVMELLDSLLIQERVAPDRVYLIGLSMGGMGTFELLARRPDPFAAAVPICGGTNPALLPIYARQVPLWIFHGADDQVVKVEQS